MNWMNAFLFFSRINEAESEKGEKLSPNLNSRRTRNSHMMTSSPLIEDIFPLRRLAILSSPLPDNTSFTFDASKIVPLTSTSMAVDQKLHDPQRKDAFFADPTLDILQFVDDPSLSSRSQSLGNSGFILFFFVFGV
jgi:hypothetical protein